ncbi:MAG TPA: DUF882 domain-containing protein [Acidobacteriaceae bacterium]|nr:DUF882 domain-containing protein [Acidobacteriaceae bacterium]
MAIGKAHLPDAKVKSSPPPLELSLFNLRTRCTRALSTLSAASLSSTLMSTTVLRGLTLGLCGLAAVGVADATSVHHFTHHRKFLAHHVARAQSTVSAQNASGLLVPPASNLEAVLNPATSISTVAAGATEANSAARYELKMHHLHSGEDIDIVYRVGNQYIPSAIAKLNYFLRDHRTQDVSHYDPREFDLLHTLVSTLGRPNAVIDIVCGYRTPWSNNYLRTRAAVTGVAKNSQHVQAKAIDIRIPGVSTSHLRDVALSLHGGGVGYYPVSEFVHVDVGPVRQWSFGGRGE